jgi:aldehyde:ferredoxin oxidoreductase
VYGYIGKIIRVILPRGKILIEEIAEETLHDYLGGVGLATKIVFDETAPNVDPLGPENTLAFAVGPFASTAVPTSGKFAVAAKSPLTGFIGYGVASGLFGPTLRSAGYDAIIIQGRARGPLYLFIDDDEIRLRPATKLAEMDAIQVEETIRGDYGDPSIHWRENGEIRLYHTRKHSSGGALWPWSSNGFKKYQGCRCSRD